MNPDTCDVCGCEIPVYAVRHFGVGSGLPKGGVMLCDACAEPVGAEPPPELETFAE